MWLREQQKLDSRRRLEACQSKVGALQNFESSQGRARYAGGYWRRSEGPSDCVNPVECTSEDEIVVRGEFGEGRREVAIID